VYLRAVEARVGVLERRLSAVRLMTAADAARHARVNVVTILRAVRAGELPVAGYVGRSSRISRDALDGWLATRSPSRRRLLVSSAEVEVGRQATLLRRHVNGWGEARARVIATPSWTPTAA
jgi:excisionase family DNA binding protein